MINTRIICVGKDTESSEFGSLDTFKKIEVSDVHCIKGNRWICVRIDRNTNYELLAEFRPYLDYVPMRVPVTGGKWVAI